MNETITELRVEDVYPNPKHYREVDAKNVELLAANIEVAGQLEPITVFRDGDIYIIDAGHHRHAALKKLGRETIKAIVQAADDPTAMVASNMHFPESEIERSRGTQLLLSTGIRPLEVAAIIGDKQDRMSKAAKGLSIAKDYAEDMSLDRLVALAEFEDDEEAARAIMTSEEAQWRRTYDDLKRKQRIKVLSEQAERVIAESGRELIKNNDMAKHAYVARGAVDAEIPAAAKYGRVTVYEHNGSVEITWYKDAGAETQESAEQAAAREAREKLFAELRADEERRVEFVRAHLMGEGPSSVSNALCDFAVAAWDEGYPAEADAIPESMVHLSSFVKRVYAAVLANVEGAAGTVLERPSYDWYIKQNGTTAVKYLAALVDVGYELSPAEQGQLEQVKAALDPQEPEGDDAEGGE